jgi:hypothetical protein
MTPTQDQRQAAKELIGYAVMRLCPHQKKRHPKCLCGEIVEEDAVRILSRMLADRESAAAYEGAMSVVKAVEEIKDEDCPSTMCCHCARKAAKKAADRLKPKV